jgi:hypothetical protein
MTSLGRACIWAPLGFGLLVSACASTPGGPRAISLAEIRGRSVEHSTGIADDERALISIATVMERDLGLPELRATLHFYPNRQAFRNALEAAGYNSDLARDTAAAMSAIGGFRRVLVNDSSLRRLQSSQRIALLAHELTHTAQYEFSSGRRSTSEQWLREGFADWVSVYVLESLDLSSREGARQRALNGLRAVGERRGLPSLSDMVTFPEWVALSVRPEGESIYEQALLAVDFLIDRHHLRRVIAYFRLFAESDDRLRHFQTAFGEDLPAFEAAFRAHLARSMR